jgi:hypothetical protein
LHYGCQQLRRDGAKTFTVGGRGRDGNLGEDTLAIAPWQTKLAIAHVGPGAFASVCVYVCVGVLGRSSKPGGKKRGGSIIVVRSNYLNLPCVVLQ